MVVALLLVAAFICVSGQFTAAPTHIQVTFYDPWSQPYSPAWDVDLNKIHDALDSRLGSLSAGQWTTIIVVGRSISELERVAADYSAQVVSRYPAINSVAMRVPAEHVFPICQDTRVHHIEDGELKFTVTLNSALSTTQVPQAYAAYPYRGEGMVIAIIDTGIDNNHMDLDDNDPYNTYKVIAFRDIINGQNDLTVPVTAYDDHGHGTHCASIAAGTGEGSSGTYRGVAYAAQLVGVKVLNSQGSGTEQQILDGMQWVIDNKNTYSIDVVSMSLGSNSPTASDGTDALCVMADAIMDAGMVLCVAAGNHGWPEFLYGYNKICSPAASKKAITVGSVNDDGTWSSFSNEGPTADNRIKPDVMAVGASVTAAEAGTTNQYVQYSGTSMATPTAAGIAALLRQANPSLTPAEIKQIMENTALDKGAVGKDNTYGSGIIQTKNALDYITGGTNNPPTCTITSPAAGSTVSGTVRVLVSATDDHGVSKVEVRIDSGSWIDITANFDGSRYYYDWDTTSVTDGTHTIEARATDGSAQTATHSISVQVENAPALPAMFLADIQVSSVRIWFWAYCQVQVTVVAGTPSQYVPLSGAAVSLRTTSPSGSVKSYTANTNSLGVALFDLGLLVRGTWVFKVTAVSHPNYNYDPSMNLTSDTRQVTL